MRDFLFLRYRETKPSFTFPQGGFAPGTHRPMTLPINLSTERIPITMNNNENLTPEEMQQEIDVYTLTDEEGNEKQFELIGEAEIDGKTYYALTELDDDYNQVSEEYVILRLEVEDGEDVLVSIDDDEEFDRVADFFDDQFSDIDYDA